MMFSDFSSVLVRRALVCSSLAVLVFTAVPVQGIETGLVEHTVVPWRSSSWRFFGSNLVNPTDSWRTLSAADLAADPTFADETKSITAVDTFADTITVSSHGLS